MGGIADGGTFWAVMPYGSSFLVVGGFSFFWGNDFGGGGRTKVWRYFYGGRRFFVFGGSEFGVGGKIKIWR